jgi:hypothetical protein
MALGVYGLQFEKADRGGEGSAHGKRTKGDCYGEMRNEGGLDVEPPRRWADNCRRAVRLRVVEKKGRKLRKTRRHSSQNSSRPAH